MFLSGVADEAGSNIDTQIKATRELGWKHFEARVVEVTGYPKGNIHDIPDRAFDILCDKVAASGLKIHCFGSAIANWGKKIDQPFDSSLAEAKRAIPRMSPPRDSRATSTKASSLICAPGASITPRRRSTG